jgi:hypothetical protein
MTLLYHTAMMRQGFDSHSSFMVQRADGYCALTVLRTETHFIRQPWHPATLAFETSDGFLYNHDDECDAMPWSVE